MSVKGKFIKCWSVKPVNHRREVHFTWLDDKPMRVADAEAVLREWESENAKPNERLVQIDVRVGFGVRRLIAAIVNK